MTNVYIPKETADVETRVAATPETVEKLVAQGLSVNVQGGAGEGSFISDSAYQDAGAEIATDPSAMASADLILKVQEPTSSEIASMKKGSTVISLFVPLADLECVKTMQEGGVNCFSMNLVPRISRAQKMDALSSQSNIAGYKAVILAASELPRYFPLLMTAAGTVKPAKVVIMGAGVAGLQAIATAKRLGAQVWATDVRIAVKEQVESLGGKFIDVPGMEDMEDEGGYAKEATKEFLELQRQVVGDQIAESDVVITTALIPGRKAPVLIPSALVERMKPGSVIVDLAAEQGGNCEETSPGETVVRHGVKIVGPVNVPGSVPVHASQLYARNVLAFLEPMVQDGNLVVDFEDEVVAGAAVVWDGEIKNDATREALQAGGQA